jgi:hypothetical protein
MPQRMYGHWLVDLRLARRRLDGLLNHRVADMVATHDTGAGVG